MKKQTLLFFLLSTIAFQIAQAQPTLTAANTNFQGTERYILKQTQYVNPGPGGANQLWDFSTIVANRNDSINLIAEINSPSFPFLQANLIIWDGSFSSSYPSYFYKISNNSKQKVGHNQWSPFGGNLQSVYTDLEDILRYPFTFQDTYSDGFRGTFISNQPNNNFTYSIIGNTIVEADGYGTLITATGTYTNTLRIKTTSSYTDSSSSGKSTTLYEVYDWYQPGTHWPIFHILKSTDISGNIIYSSRTQYLKQVILSTSEVLAAAINLQLYPNPTSEKATLSYDLKKTAQVKITLLNMLGQEVDVLLNEEQGAGSKMQQLELEKHPNGMYLVQLQLDNQLITKRLIKQ